MPVGQQNVSTDVCVLLAKDADADHCYRSFELDLGPQFREEGRRTGEQILMKLRTVTMNGETGISTLNAL